MNMHVTIGPEDHSEDDSPAAKQVRGSLAIVQAITAGELLAALPDSDYDRQRHQTAVTLLDVLEARLLDTLAMLGAQVA